MDNIGTTRNRMEKEEVGNVSERNGTDNELLMELVGLLSRV